MAHLETFEDIVSHSLPPQEWYDLKLYANFPGIDPTGMIGEIAIMMARGDQATKERWTNYFAEGGEDKVEREALRRASRRDEMQWQVFEGMYSDIRGNLEFLNRRGETPCIYEDFIEGAYRRQMQSVYQDPECSDRLVRHLLRYAQGLSVHYSLESELHFRELQGLPMDAPVIID